MSERCRREMIGLVVLVAVGCGAEEDAFELRASEIVGGTAVAADTAGYGVVINGDALGSGMFLAPGWVITAGHVLADWDDVGRWTFSSPPSAGVEFGTTFDGSQGTPFVHPNWWGALGAPPPPIGNRDLGFDVGLIRLSNARDGSTFPNKLYNQLSNGWAAGTFRCYGYGATNLNGSGGGAGMLQTFDFATTNYEIHPGSGLPRPTSPSSVDMITVADGPGGQRLFHGDSGGPCMNVGQSPYVIQALTSNYRDFPDGSHKTYTVDAWSIKDWVDQTMHGTPETLPGTPPGSPFAFTSAATKTGLSRRLFMILTSMMNWAPQMRVNSGSGWSAWGALSPIPLQGGSHATHGIVGITSILDGAGDPRILMAVWSGSDTQSVMFVSPNMIPGTAVPWNTFTWSNAGSAPAGTKFKQYPAIAAIGPVSTSRVDYFTYASNDADSNGAIYYRWKFNGAWQNSSWQQIPNPPDGVTIKSSPSVALKGNTLYLAARGSNGEIWINTLPNVTNSATYGGPWAGWFSIGGGWLGPPAITAWDRGVDVYSLGTDSKLYHTYMDGDGAWSNNIAIGSTTYSSVALTAANLLPTNHEVNIIGNVPNGPGGPSPRVTRFPW